MQENKGYIFFFLPFTVVSIHNFWGFSTDLITATASVSANLALTKSYQAWLIHQWHHNKSQDNEL